MSNTPSIEDELRQAKRDIERLQRHVSAVVEAAGLEEAVAASDRKHAAEVERQAAERDEAFRNAYRR